MASLLFLSSEPKVWLDEIIINQDNIEESLKCLPVYLMSCTNMLVLCGETVSNKIVACTN